MFNNIIFSNPELLWLIIALVFFVVVNHRIKHLKSSKLKMSSINLFTKASFKITLYPFLNLLRYLALGSLIIDF